MNEPGYFLVVRFWVAPQAAAGMLGWLDGGHMAEVASQPGFLWCKRIKVADDKDGWIGYSMIYGIASKAHFDAYEANLPLKQKFARERQPFEKHLRIDRFAGAVV